MVLILFLAALGCESSYHPEYHPVTVTTVHQAYSTPTVVSTTPAGSGAKVIVMPAAPPPAVIQQPPLADPDTFFQPQ